jgi:hypothetical protein
MSHYPLRPWLRRGVQGFLLLSCALAASNFLHHLLWKTSLMQIKLHQVLQPAGYVVMVCGYLLMFYSFWINLWWTRHRRGFGQRQLYLDQQFHDALDGNQHAVDNLYAHRRGELQHRCRQRQRNHEQHYAHADCFRSCRGHHAAGDV